MAKNLYEVKLLVTREEFYRVSAESEEEAYTKAFVEGQKVDMGETTGVDFGSIKLVRMS